MWLGRILSSLVVVSGLALGGEMWPADLFTDNAVLQREKPVPVWGRAKPGTTITVSFRKQVKSAATDAAGRWAVELEPLEVGGPDTLTISSAGTLTLKNILVGEVWLASGQSNMALTMRECKDLAKDLARANRPEIRFSSPNFLDTADFDPLDEKNHWRAFTAEAAGDCSALMFYFALRLHEELGVPVGLILRSVSGTGASCWVRPEDVDANWELQRWSRWYAEKYRALAAECTRQTKEQNESAAKPRPADRPRMPREPGPRGRGELYYQRIAPCVPYAIRGVCWDQGESGPKWTGVDQSVFMRVLFQSWRTQWRWEDLPFVIVQKPSGQGCGWTPEARDSSGAILPLPKLPATPAETDQSYTGGFWRADFNSQMTVPGVHLVIADDLGAGTHPPDKDRYGQRMALVALGAVYGKKHEYGGPVYRSMSREGNKIRLTFQHVGQGLVARGTEQPQGFMVAGDDQAFHWAEARIEKDSVVVWSHDVREPVAVRYAWAWMSPWANLFNRDGFPALLFRTDAWPGPGPYLERR